MIAEATRTCKRCGKEKSITSFREAKSGNGVCRVHVCNNCKYIARKPRLDTAHLAEYQKKWRSENGDKLVSYYWESLLKAKWKPWMRGGIRIKASEIEQAYNRQGGACRLCGSEDGSIGRLELDIDDKGEFHGLICLGCKVEASAR
jgi:hypothetical protein